MTKKETSSKKNKEMLKKEKVEKVKKVEQKESKEKKHAPLHCITHFISSVKEKHLADILEDLLTEKEIKEIAERIEILKQLHKWVTQRTIAQHLKISVTTVSRWSKVLQTGKQKIKKYI